jgi:hypothetical protein
MAINVNSISEYVDVNRDELFVKAIASAKSIDYMENMLDVKYKSALNYLNSTVVLGDGSECGWNAQGEDTITQKFVEVFPIAVNKEFCHKDLRKTWANHQLVFEAGRETLPFEQKFIESNMTEIKKAVEKLVWSGNVSLSIDGLIKQINAEATAVKVGEKATVKEAIDATIESIPAGALEKGVNLFLSWSDFRKYVAELNAECCGSRPMIDANVDTLGYFGDSRITLVPVAGLEGTKTIVSAPYDALVFATDVNDSESTFDFWYDKKDDKFLLKVLFNAGTAVKYADEVTIATIA